MVGAGAAFAGAGALCAYAALWPASQIFGRTLLAPPLPGELALTFDDGPNPTATPRLLEILARRGVPATFFVIGDYVQREPALAREMLAAGHTIGNHTMHHPWLPRHTNATIRAEIAGCSTAIEQTLGVPAKLFRPPHGSRRPAVLRIARELGMQTVQWNLIVGDWNPRSSPDLLGRIERGIAANARRGRGTNLVLHDGGQFRPDADRSATVDAVEMLLETLPAATHFVTPPQWT